MKLFFSLSSYLLYNESELFAREPLFSSADLFFDDILCRADIKYLYVTQFNYKLELHSCTLMFTSIWYFFEIFCCITRIKYVELEDFLIWF